MAAAFREMFDEKEYRLIDENKGMEVSEAINRAVEDFKEHSSDTQMLSLDCYSIMLLLSDQSNHTHDNDDQSYVRFIKPVIDAIEESYMDDISCQPFYRHVQETYRDDTGAVSEAVYIRGCNCFLYLIGFDVKIYLSEIWCENE